MRRRHKSWPLSDSRLALQQGQPSLCPCGRCRSHTCADCLLGAAGHKARPLLLLPSCCSQPGRKGTGWSHLLRTPSVCGQCKCIIWWGGISSGTDFFKYKTSRISGRTDVSYTPRGFGFGNRRGTRSCSAPAVHQRLAFPQSMRSVFGPCFIDDALVLAQVPLVCGRAGTWLPLTVAPKPGLPTSLHSPGPLLTLKHSKPGSWRRPMVCLPHPTHVLLGTIRQR